MITYMAASGLPEAQKEAILCLVNGLPSNPSNPSNVFSGELSMPSNRLTASALRGSGATSVNLGAWGESWVASSCAAAELTCRFSFAILQRFVHVCFGLECCGQNAKLLECSAERSGFFCVFSLGLSSGLGLHLAATGLAFMRLHNNLWRLHAARWQLAPQYHACLHREHLAIFRKSASGHLFSQNSEHSWKELVRFGQNFQPWLSSWGGSALAGLSQW
mmetsp:Transcript_2214/g.4079  ORF Transcript_2214/g.4079 Transcript_2214/m.4079 type:complete len:219 (-) Transcript_2214:433-1089(-)